MASSSEWTIATYPSYTNRDGPAYMVLYGEYGSSVTGWLRAGSLRSPQHRTRATWCHPRWGGSRRRLAPTTTVPSGQGRSSTRRRNSHNGGVTVRETLLLPLRQSGSVVTTGWYYPSVVGDGSIGRLAARGLRTRDSKWAPSATPHHTGQRPCEFTGRGFWREPGGWSRS